MDKEGYDDGADDDRDEITMTRRSLRCRWGAEDHETTMTMTTCQWRDGDDEMTMARWRWQWRWRGDDYGM